MQAEDRLNAARVAVCEGRYDAALVDLVWFHEHALEETPSLYGVRLSYALGAWADLAVFYPPAMAALRDTRAQTAAALLRAEGGGHAFHDVASIDEALHQTDQTYRLYVQLEQEQPAIAATCATLALDAILGAGDFTRAAHVIGAPEQAVRAYGDALERDLRYGKRARYSPAPARWAFLVNYLERVQRVIAIATGVGNPAQAASLAQLAVNQIRNPSVRRDVQAGLVRWPRAPNPGLKRHKLQILRARRRATADRRRAGIM